MIELIRPSLRSLSPEKRSDHNTINDFDPLCGAHQEPKELESDEAAEKNTATKTSRDPKTRSSRRRRNNNYLSVGTVRSTISISSCPVRVLQTRGMNYTPKARNEQTRAVGPARAEADRRSYQHATQAAAPTTAAGCRRSRAVRAALYKAARRAARAIRSSDLALSTSPGPPEKCGTRGHQSTPRPSEVFSPGSPDIAHNLSDFRDLATRYASSC
ncbi:unnamed protein product [Trichogramma brassicae]|uniref:Uncharacterized protein n=1 Tax=Trichogramma brassicae TaxID=86971 RepID=A0A6H5J4Q1_9HYME|nr:unnamed protein product [Trichogramma brassicae]